MLNKITGNIFFLIMLCFLQSCNPLGELEKLDSSLGQDNTTNATIDSASWNFSNSGNYTFDPNYISVTAGRATLLQVDQTHNEATDFAAGTHVGTAYSASSLTTGSAGGCDSTMTNCFSLNEDWTPQYSSLIFYLEMNQALGNIANGGAVNAAIGATGFVGDAGGDSSVNIISGKVNNALSMAVNDTLTVNGSVAPNPNDNFTVMFWLQDTGSLSNFGLIARKIQVAGWEIKREGTLTFLQYRIDTDAGVNQFSVGTHDVFDGNNHHIVLKVESGVLSAYVDGKEDITPRVLNMGTGISDATADLTLGIQFEGIIDEFALFSQPLSESEIINIYQRQMVKYAGYYSSPVLDLGTSSNWTNIDWITSLPFEKELPGNSGNELSTNYGSLVDQTGASGDSDLSDGLVGLWHLNEAVENTAPGGLDFQDSSANGLHAFRDPAGNTTLGNPGILDKAPVFDRSRGIIIGNLPITDMNLSDWSVSAWFKLPSSVTARRGIVSKKEGSFGDFGWSMETEAGTLRARLDGPSGNIQRASLAVINDDKWHHGVITFDRDNLLTIYIDGKLDRTLSISALAGDTISNATPLVIGCKADCTVNQFDGSIDEVGTWSRVLNPAEVLELYRRGTNRVKFQVRSCDDPACVGDQWVGPDGSPLTYFSELHNCTSINGATGECDGNVQTQSPSLNFSDFVSPPANNQYFQYRTILESDDENNACAGGTQTCLPSVSSIEVGPTGRYFAGSPMIVNTTPVAFTSLSAFTETAGGTCIVTYQVSSDGVTFYYWTGVTWAIASGVAQSNNAADINTNISSFTGVAGAGSLFWKAFLTSDTSQDCELDELNFSY